MTQPPPGPVAYSLLRFSSPKQAKGDSVRRQTAGAERWAERQRVPLDRSLWLFDPQASAFTGEHKRDPERHALAAFLVAVKAGLVPRGAFLIVENLDRISREQPLPALSTFLELLSAGVRVVQLLPYEQVYDERSDYPALMNAMNELARGHGESKTKSDRVGEAWEERRKRARDGQEPLTRRLPGWIRYEGGALVVDPQRADVIRTIFRLAREGRGLHLTIRYLTERGVPTFGSGKRWSQTYLGKLLHDRRVLGHFQPRHRDGTAAGPEIPDYFPRVISDEEFTKAQLASQARGQKRGRVGREVNVFAGLIRSATDGSSYNAGASCVKGKRYRYLISQDGKEGRGPWLSFPYEVLERAVFAWFREIDPRELLTTERPADSLRVLRAEYEEIKAHLARLEAQIEPGADIPTLASAVKRWTERQREVGARLAEARALAASPLADAWEEGQGLLATIDVAVDRYEARLRLRGIFRRIVSQVLLLVIPRGLDRFAAVQIHFAGGEEWRSVIILHQPPRANGFHQREAGGWARHVADVLPGRVWDLRDPTHIAALQTALASVPV